MPRHARIVWPGELYHVTQRGNYRQNIFYENQDRVVYLRYIEENAKRYRLQVYAFCLMNNHVHFVVKPGAKDSLAKVFRVANQRYALYLNRRLNEYGHRWQSRYYSCLLLGSHISKAVRYVENNPVRAGIVGVPWEYPWSSARTHFGKTYRVITLSDIKEYIQVSSWKRYLVEDEDEGDLEYLRSSTMQGKVFGPSNLVWKLQKRLGRNLYPQPRGRKRKQ